MEEVIDQIAQEYLESVRIKADYIAARCPFHSVKSGTQFWVNRSTGAWGCFSCGAGGSSIRWLLKELGVKKHSIEHTIKEAEKDRSKKAAIAKIQRQKKAKARFEGMHVLPEALLGLWDVCPLALVEDGFTEEILRRHDIGFDEKRMRMTFPIRDIKGNLIGVSGRSVDGSWPKYKVYQGWHDSIDDEGKTYRSPGELGHWFPDYSSTDIRSHLYRGNFVYQDLFDGKEDHLIIVEGYKAALWLVQMGYEYTVALMGSKMSQGQERIIRRLGAKTYVLLDNNSAGQDGADYICSKLGNCTFPVYRCRYPEGSDESTQPDDLTEDQVTAVFQSAARAAGRLRRRA